MEGAAKIYIQRVASNRYVGTDNAWVSSLCDARDFGTSLIALDFCMGRQLSMVQIRACFTDYRRDVVWRVTDVHA